MIEGVTVRQLQKNIDARGWLAEIWRNDETEYRPVMSYVSVTKSGVARGPHEHEKQADCFIFLGPGTFEVYLWDRRENSPTKGEQMKFEAGENFPSMVIVPPGVVHGYKNISQSDAFCINLPDKLYCGEGKREDVDEIRWEKEKDSPYKI